MLACVALERVSPRKSVSTLRRPTGGDGSSGILVDRLEALHRGPGLNQRAIDAEVLGGQKPLHPRLRQDGRQEPGGDSAFSSRSRFFEKVE